MKKILLTILIIVSFLFFGFARADEVSENREAIQKLEAQIKAKKQKVEELEKNIEQYKNKIQKVKNEGQTIKNQIGLLDNKISQVETDIDLTETKIETLSLEIQELDLIIKEKQRKIDNQKKLLMEFINTIHIEKNKKAIEIILAYDNLSDFYNRVKFLETIEQDVYLSAKALRLAKEELEDQKKNREERKLSVDILKNTLVDKKQDLDEQKYTKEDLFKKTKQSEATYATLLSSLKKQYSAIEDEIIAYEDEVRKKLEKEKKLTANSLEDNSKTLSWPTDGRYITARFHDPEYPFRHVFEHNAIDIRAKQSTQIFASGNGYVAKAKKCTVSSCYSYLVIVHSEGISTVYGHLSKILVKEEQFVKRGSLIAYSGGTPGTSGAGPFVTGPHLHFEVRKNGVPVNPLNYLIKDY